MQSLVGGLGVLRAGVGRQGGQRYQGDRLVARMRHRDPVGGIGPGGRGVDQDLLEQRLGHRARLDARGARHTLLGPVHPGHHDLPVRRRAQPRQQHRGGHPQAGGDLGGRGARLDQFQDLLGEPPPYRAGRVPPVAFDGDQLGDALQQVEPLGGPVARVGLDGQQPVRQDGLADIPGGRRGAPAGVTDREERVRRTADRRPVRAAAAGADGGQMLARECGTRPGGQRLARARDLAAGGGEHPGAQVQVGAEEVEDDLRAAARRARGHQPSVPVDDCGEVARALAGDLPDDVLGDRRECNGLVDCEQRQPMARTRCHQILRDVAHLGLAGREPGDPRARQDPDERLRVVRRMPPCQPGQHQLAAREIAAGVLQVGGHHTADRRGRARPRRRAAAAPAHRSPAVRAAASRRRRSVSLLPVPLGQGFHGETVRLPGPVFRSNLQDGTGGQPTPSWFR